MEDKNAWMIRLLGAVLFLAAGSMSYSAWADWGISGAQYSCSAAKGTFELLPHDQSSSDPPKGIPVGKGFKALPDGMSTLNCALGTRRLQAQIGVTQPQAHGQCMGGGSVQVTSLAVDGVELLDGNLPFEWSCGNEESVVRLVVRANSQGVEFEKCAIGARDTPGAEAKRTCATRVVKIDVIAAKNAKLDHDLADVTTQEATSVTKLSASYDLAKVFPPGPVPRDVSLCAHWSDVFLNAILNPDKQWHARIAGTVGERVFIHPTSPPLCRSSTDDGCNPTAYLIPGDRVDLGFICGPWSYVQYERHVRSKASIIGWVETARLYGDDKSSGTVGDASSSAPRAVAPPPKDPLVAAAFTNDLGRIKAIVAAGEHPDGLDKAGNPLANAMAAGNLEAAQLLLSLGASANPKNSDGTCRNLFTVLPSFHVLPAQENGDIFSILVKSRADLNCRSGTWLTTALMSSSGSNRIWAWRWDQEHDGHGAKINDQAGIVSRLLKAGADPNVRDLAGQTALFYVSEPNNIDIAAILLAGGANPNISTDESPDGIGMGDQTGSTPLMRALSWYPLTHDPTMIQLLLDHGADPNYRNKTAYDEDCDATTQGKCTFQGQTVLTRAAEDGDYTVVRLLLGHGADPNVARADGSLPADIARKNRHPEVAALFENAVSQH